MIKDENGTLKKVASYLGVTAGSWVTEFATEFAVGSAMLAAGVVSAPVVLGGAFLSGAISYALPISIGFDKLNKVDFEHRVDDKLQNEDYITFDEEIIIYHDGTKEIRRINVENYTRIISK